MYTIYTFSKVSGFSGLLDNVYLSKAMIAEDYFLTRDVEIFENERYQLTALSFSAKGLLPSDR